MDSNHPSASFSRKPPARRTSQRFSSSGDVDLSRSLSDRRLASPGTGRKLSTSSDKKFPPSVGDRRRKFPAFSSAAGGGRRKFSQASETREFSESYHPSQKKSAEISSAATGRKFSSSSTQGGFDKGERRRVSGTHGGGDDPFASAEEKRHGTVVKPDKAGIRLDLERVLRADLERVLR